MVCGTRSQPQLLVLHGAGQEVATQKRGRTELYPSRPTTFQRGLNFRFPQSPLTAVGWEPSVKTHSGGRGAIHIQFTAGTAKLQNPGCACGQWSAQHTEAFVETLSVSWVRLAFLIKLAKGNEPVHTCPPQPKT